MNCSCSEKCHFTGEEVRFHEYGGKTWCQFHLPEDFYVDLRDNDGKRYRSIVHEFKLTMDKYVNDKVNSRSQLNLRGVVFPVRYDFVNLTLSNPIFNDVIFTEIVDFSGTNFDDRAYFTGTIFKGIAVFHGTTFSDHCSFLGAIFYNKLHFGPIKDKKTEFKSSVNFTFAAFSSYTYFDKVTFHGKFDIRGGPYNASKKSLLDNGSLPFITFENSTFKEKSVFNNRKFLDTCNFKNSKFFKAPDFHNCDLHQDTIFKGTIFYDTKSPESESSYRTLRLSMGEIKSREEEGRFYALEQEAIRNNNKNSYFYNVMSYAYKLISNYGQSIARPFVGLFLSLIFFTSTYAVIASPSIDIRKTIDWTIVYQSSGFALEQIVTPFRVWRQKSVPPWFYKDNLSSNSPQGLEPLNKLLTVKFISTSQSIISTIFLALGLLALRWRYKRG